MLMEHNEMMIIQFMLLPMLLIPEANEYYVASLLAGLLTCFITGAFPSVPIAIGSQQWHECR